MKETDREGEYAPKIEATDALSLLRQVILNYPRRSHGIDALHNVLESRGIILSCQRLAGVEDLQALLDGKCQRRYVERSYRDAPPTYYTEERSPSGHRRGVNFEQYYTSDQALFVVLHPQDRNGRWASLTHHNFTWYTDIWGAKVWAADNFGWYSIFESLGLERYFEFPWRWSVPFCLVSGFDDPRELKKIPRVEVASFSREQTGIMMEEGLFLPFGSRETTLHANMYVYVPLGKPLGKEGDYPNWERYNWDRHWAPGWEVFAISGVKLTDRLLPSSVSFPPLILGTE